MAVLVWERDGRVRLASNAQQAQFFWTARKLEKSEPKD